MYVYNPWDCRYIFLAGDFMACCMRLFLHNPCLAQLIDTDLLYKSVLTFVRPRMKDTAL